MRNVVFVKMCAMLSLSNRLTPLECWPVHKTSSYDRTTSVTNLLRQLNLEPLDKRRRIYRLTFLYKVLNEHVAVPPVKLDIKQNGRPVRGSVTKQRLVIPRCSTNELKNSFVPRTIVQWNALPDSTTSAASVNAFRSQLYKYCP